MIAIFPEIVQAAEAGDLERLAVLARKYFGGGTTYAPSPDVRALLVNAGVDVQTLPLDTPGALIAKDERGAFRIVAIAGERRDAVEENFLLAHMLGHVLIDVMPLIAKGEWQGTGYREGASPLQRYVQGGIDSGTGIDAQREERADRFAAALLMPLGMAKRAEAQFKDLDKTAAFFGVPRGLLERRLQDLGVLTPTPVNFLDAEAQKPRPAKRAAKPLSAPEPSMPRSYAASTYGQTERSTRKAEPKTEKAKTSPAAPKAAPTPPAPGIRGMDRLRELARKLDKGEK